MCLGCTQGDIRLVGGSSSNQGTVEVCYYNTWGLVDDRNWGTQEAKVVCRQLNFQGIYIYTEFESVNLLKHCDNRYMCLEYMYSPN